MRLCLTLFLFGCGVGSGKGSVVGSLYIRSCTSDSDYGMSVTQQKVYDMHPQFFAASPVDDFQREHPMNRLSIRVQPSGNRVEEADVLSVMIASDHEVAMHMNEELPVGPATNVRATLNLNSTCPKTEVEMELDGTIRWTSFGSATADAGVSDDFKIDFDDRLTASFSFDVLDRRAATLGGLGGVSPDASVAGKLDGSFDFVVHQGRAAQSP